MDNIAYFDKTSTDGFSVQKGCTYACGFSYTQFQTLSGNLYWRTDGAFASDTKAFHIQPNPSSPLCDTLNTSKTDWNYYTFAGCREWAKMCKARPRRILDCECDVSDRRLHSIERTIGWICGVRSKPGRKAERSDSGSNLSPTFATAPLNPATDY